MSLNQILFYNYEEKVVRLIIANRFIAFCTKNSRTLKRLAQSETKFSANKRFHDR